MRFDYPFTPNLEALIEMKSVFREIDAYALRLGNRYLCRRLSERCKTRKRNITAGINLVLPGRTFTAKTAVMSLLVSE